MSKEAAMSALASSLNGGMLRLYDDQDRLIFEQKTEITFGHTDSEPKVIKEELGFHEWLRETATYRRDGSVRFSKQRSIDYGKTWTEFEFRIQQAPPVSFSPLEIDICSQQTDNGECNVAMNTEFSKAALNEIGNSPIMETHRKVNRALDRIAITVMEIATKEGGSVISEEGYSTYSWINALSSNLGHVTSEHGREKLGSENFKQADILADKFESMAVGLIQLAIRMRDRDEAQKRAKAELEAKLKAEVDRVAAQHLWNRLDKEMHALRPREDSIRAVREILANSDLALMDDDDELED